MYSIETKALTKRYGCLTAVDSLDLSVKDGELFSLLGVNGAGKTTTIRMLTGLTLPTSGDAFICGHSILTDIHTVKQISNVSPQETAVAPLLTVRENLVLIAGIYGMDDPVAKADEMLAEFSLDERANTRAGKLSGGMQRRLSIALGLISEPKVLFLDEPTLGLDVIARRELWLLLESLKGKVTIVLTTHYMEEAEALSDRIGVMAEGKLKAVGTVSELNSLAGCDSFEDTFITLASKGGISK